jgi:NADH-quinone oxidoreductase subunit L
MLTALYESRATFLAFFSEPRYEGHPHDPGFRMRVALIVLGIGAIAGGLLGISSSSGLLPRFLRPVVGAVHKPEGGPPEWALIVISTATALVGIGLAWFVYLSKRIDWQALRTRLWGTKRTLERAFYVNDFYSSVIVAPAKMAAAFLAYVFDARVIDGAVNGLARSFRGLAGVGRRVQTGLVRNYALAFLAGAVGILCYVAVRF